MPGKLNWQGGGGCHGMGGCNVSFAKVVILSILHKGFCGTRDWVLGSCAPFVGWIQGTRKILGMTKGVWGPLAWYTGSC